MTADKRYTSLSANNIIRRESRIFKWGGGGGGEFLKRIREIREIKYYFNI